MPSPINGTNGNDLPLNGTDNNDTIYGNNGHDDIWGWNGRDLIFGGEGNDTINGGNGNDQMHGDAGNDVMSGDGNVNGLTGDDWMTGGLGNDTLYGNAGNDSLRGDAGSDVLSGGTGIDTAYYTSQVTIGNSKAYTADGIDELISIEKISASRGNDHVVGDYMEVRGNAGNDYLEGGAGANTLKGDQGNDTLVGRNGADILFGGAGADKFRYFAASESQYAGVCDVIKDFQVGLDKIDLSAFGVGFDVNGGPIGSYQVGVHYGDQGMAWVYVNTDGDNAIEMQITLENSGHLSSSDFIL